MTRLRQQWKRENVLTSRKMLRQFQLSTGLRMKKLYLCTSYARGGALRLEFDELYNALFTNADKYVDIVRYTLYSMNCRSCSTN